MLNFDNFVTTFKSTSVVVRFYTTLFARYAECRLYRI